MPSAIVMSDPVNAFEQFRWEPQPEAERLVDELVSKFLASSGVGRALSELLQSKAGVRFKDIVDHVTMPASEASERRLLDVGFVPDAESEATHFAGCFRQPHGIFPPVCLRLPERRGTSLGIKVDSVVDFDCAVQSLAANLNYRRTDFSVGGEPLSTVRWHWVTDATPLADGGTASIAAIERHGYRGFGVRRPAPRLEAAVAHLERFRMRWRGHTFEPRDEERGFSAVENMVDAAVADLGVDYACDLFFAAEREFWQRRNRAAQVQKARQDKLGIGWANHDHHTYRSSRRHFARLVGIWEKLGFVCRERFYAGREAGWGAQVMEQPNAGIVTFNDVDLSPDELLVDFAHEPLPERHALGTVGLWCGLHGESFLEAGMHHLECTFDFAALKEQLERDHGVPVMKPFTDFPYLKQAFTQGERWPVKEERVARLLGKGQITAEQADKFRREGAIGSHLENLERNQGFKGFNQTGVSEIIAATDPRKQTMR
jgi:hypothetical protein